MMKALRMMDVYPLTNGKVVRFHGDCYTLWNEERRAGGHTEPAIPPPQRDPDPDHGDHEPDHSEP
jgi:hypothetical protein